MFVENELYRYLVILFIFLCGSAFYSASETALSTVRSPFHNSGRKQYCEYRYGLYCYPFVY